MIKKVSTGNLANISAIFLCLTFLLICFNYSTKINLWGDETYSLQLAGKSWQQIFTTLDVHLPTYYYFLKILINIFGDSKEIVLRLIHSILFSLGLFVGYQTIVFLSSSTKKSLLVLLAAVFSPTFVFYATNIRMYSLFFLFSMFYIQKLSQLVTKPELATKKRWTIYLLTSACLILLDYPGVVVFLVGSALLCLKFFQLGKFNKVLLALLPLTCLLIYLFQLVPGLQSILAWKTTANSQTTFNNINFAELSRWFANAFRPVLDLFSSLQKDWVTALLAPVVFAIGLFVCFLMFVLKFLRQNKHQISNNTIVAVFGFYWILLVIAGHNLTRVFLPALFFMPAFLILTTDRLPRMFTKLNPALFGLLIVVNFSQILSPTLHLYSVIPYKTIASEAIRLAQKEKINDIFLSANSLNSQSVKWYIEKNSNLEVHVFLVSTGSEPELLNKKNFIFISHMGESNNFVDYKTFSTDQQTANVKTYIKLDDLPYNSLWKDEIKSRAFQDYAISVYLVKKGI